MQTRYPYDPADPRSVALETGAQFTLSRYAPMSKTRAVGWCRFCQADIEVKHPKGWFVPVLREATKEHLDKECQAFAEAYEIAVA